MKVVIEKIDCKNKNIQYCLDIRNKVFVEEQGVPLTDEMDGHDPECDHFLLFIDNKPTGTARIRYVENTAKIERVAILNTFRGMNLGRKLMEDILEDIGKNSAIKKAVLGSQKDAIPFYTKLGFEICGEEYMDAGILHRDMQRIFNNLTISMQDNMPKFTPINQENWSRKKVFEHYYHQVKCTYSLTADIAIGNLRSLCKERDIKLYPALLYILSRAVNEIEEMRINYNEEGVLGTWNAVSPCHTVFHQDDKTFSNIWTSYNPDFSIFYKAYLEDISQYGNTKDFMAKPNAPGNTFPVSSIPWVDFTGFNLNIHDDATYLCPIFTFGKFRQEGNDILIPLSAQLHHALCDGYHAGLFFEALRNLAQSPEEWLFGATG